MRLSMIGMTTVPIHDCESHSHEEWEIILYDQGTGSTFVSGKTMEFQPGTVLLIPPFADHREIGDFQFQDYYIRADNFIWPYPAEPCSFFDGEKRLVTLASFLFAEFYSGSADRAPVCDALFQTVYQYLLQLQGSRSASPLIDHVKAEIVRGITVCGFRVSDVIAATGYSPDHFRKLFQGEAGCTPQEYLVQLRMDYAKRLLHQNRNMPRIKDVALSCGFSDPYYFTRVFHRHTGMSPGEYAGQ